MLSLVTLVSAVLVLSYGQTDSLRQTDRQTDRHTDTHTENQRITDAAKRLTHATVVCVSNEGGNRLCSKKQLI